MKGHLRYRTREIPIKPDCDRVGTRDVQSTEPISERDPAGLDQSDPTVELASASVVRAGIKVCNWRAANATDATGLTSALGGSRSRNKTD